MDKIVCYLSDVRKELGITQQQLADACGTSTHTIIDIEKNRKSPSLFMALTICHQLGLNVDELFHYEGDEPTLVQSTKG